MDQIPVLKKQVLEQAKSKKLGEYVWAHGIGPQMGWTENLPLNALPIHHRGLD